MRFVEHRIGDRRINRLIRKWLKAGVMEEGELVSTETGTPQGAVASPLLANIYLHYVFDLWADQLLGILLDFGFGAKCGAPHFAPLLPNSQRIGSRFG